MYEKFLAADFGLDSQLKEYELNAYLDKIRNSRWEEATHKLTLST